jgi:cell division septum initiation protein DivIVA
MARRDSSNRKGTDVNPNSSSSLPSRRAAEFDIYHELTQLQDLILDSFHVPGTPWTLIAEGKILDQLEIIEKSVPTAIDKAISILEEEDKIITRAQDYAAQIIQAAEHKAAQILDETGIIQQAERQALQIRQQVQQECTEIQDKTLIDLEQMRRSVEMEIEQLRHQTMQECNQIQNGADEYADAVLTHLEEQLTDMLKVVVNGRQQIHSNHNSPERRTQR